MMTRKWNVKTHVAQLTWCLVGFLGAVSMTVAPAFAAAADSLPRDIKGCVLWVKADAGVATDSNGRVTQWLDQSGQPHHIDKVSGNAPVLATGLNGKPVVRFDGQGSLEGSHNFSKSLSAHSLLLLARWTDKDAAHCQRILFSPAWNWAFGFNEGDDQSWGGGVWIYQKDWNIYGPGSLNTHWHLHTATIGDGPKQWTEFWKDGTEVMQRRLSLPPGPPSAAGRSPPRRPPRGRTCRRRPTPSGARTEPAGRCAGRSGGGGGCPRAPSCAGTGWRWRRRRR
jgi:hypothetical protein